MLTSETGKIRLPNIPEYNQRPTRKWEKVVKNEISIHDRLKLEVGRRWREITLKLSEKCS